MNRIEFNSEIELNHFIRIYRSYCIGKYKEYSNKNKDENKTEEDYPLNIKFKSVIVKDDVEVENNFETLKDLTSLERINKYAKKVRKNGDETKVKLPLTKTQYLKMQSELYEKAKSGDVVLVMNKSFK